MRHKINRSLGHLFEPALNGSTSSSALESRAVDLLHNLSALVRPPSHQILLHLELETTVFVEQIWVFAGIVSSGHQGRLAVFEQLPFFELFHLLTVALLVEFCE